MILRDSTNFQGLQDEEVRKELIKSHNVNCPNLIDGIFGFEELEHLVNVFKAYKNIDSAEKPQKELELINLLKKFYNKAKISEISIHNDLYMEDYRKRFLTA